MVPVKVDAQEPLETQAFLEGKRGANDWYLSTVNILLRTRDRLSAPQSVTYWIDQSEPHRFEYQPPQNPITNPSFEKGFLTQPSYWVQSDPPSEDATLWRTQTEVFDGYYSVATYVYQAGNFFWDNSDFSFTVIPGELCTISIYIKTENLVGDGSWIEVWDQKESGDSKIYTSQKISGTENWQMLAFSFVIPPEAEKAYLKLVTQAESGITFWDNIFCTISFHEASTSFTFGTSGNHTLYFFAENTEGGKEDTRQLDFKIDTQAPDFDPYFGTIFDEQNQTYTGTIGVSDVNSGIKVNSAVFRSYPDINSEWSAWIPVLQVSPASDGFTDEVHLQSQPVFFPSGITGSFQFKIDDVAGNEGQSSKINTSKAWFQLEGRGELYTQGEVVANSLPPQGNYNLLENAFSQQGIQNIISENERTVSHYTGDSQQLTLMIKSFRNLESKARKVQDGIVPSVDGIYLFSQPITLDDNSLTIGFEKAQFSAVIIVEGTLRIKKSFQLAPESRVVWIVLGNVEVEGAVSEIAGVYLVDGSFKSNVDNQSGKSLAVYGSVLATQEIELTRDLGLDENNLQPAEKFIFDPAYFFDEKLLGFLCNGRLYQWEEE